jgi:histidinol dehydrogenase
MGGVQAIAAFTYGTETVKPVNFIAGPGNPYVQAAKLQVFGKVGVDMLSGPSEALILADKTAKPAFLAADILARCEHGSDSAGVVVTNSIDIAKKILKEIKKQSPSLKRQLYIKNALKNFSAIILVKSQKEMIDFANEYSAEHLEVQTANARELLPKLRNAGSIFLGDYAPVAVGDYASGTNHCLPTGVAPKFASPVGVRMFMKASGYQYLTKQGLKRLKPIVETLSDVEGLDAHKRSVQIRFERTER